MPRARFSATMAATMQRASISTLAPIGHDLTELSANGAKGDMPADEELTIVDDHTI